MRLIVRIAAALSVIIGCESPHDTSRDKQKHAVNSIHLAGKKTQGGHVSRRKIVEHIRYEVVAMSGYDYVVKNGEIPQDESLKRETILIFDIRCTGCSAEACEQIEMDNTELNQYFLSSMLTSVTVSSGRAQFSPDNLIYHEILEGRKHYRFIFQFSHVFTGGLNRFLFNDEIFNNGLISLTL